MLTEVKERPILFSGPMVRAILDGRKTQTRRIVKNHPGCGFEIGGYHKAVTDRHGEQYPACNESFGIFAEDGSWSIECPYGQPGERLWVRESWAPASAALPSASGVVYRADYHTGLEKRDGDQKWKPSIHMFRQDSRINLEITGIRVERLQAISEADAIAEGCIKLPASGRITDTKGGQYGGRIWTTARAWYAELWNQINGPLSWAENPFVWVVEFRKV